MRKGLEDCTNSHLPTLYAFIVCIALPRATVNRFGVLIIHVYPLFLTDDAKDAILDRLGYGRTSEYFIYFSYSQSDNTLAQVLMQFDLLGISTAVS